MDDIVKAALKKWPNVPHCHDWLALDARGDWYMRDERIQAAGPFPQVKGSRITHEKLREFIHRNYLPDAQGAWFFQNGPQRVYVTLELTPHVWRLHGQAADGSPRVHSHTGPEATVLASWLDEDDRLLLAARLPGLPDPVLGLVHSLDMGEAAEAVEQGLWRPESTTLESLCARYRVVRHPQP
ncbi:DUF2946 family protein [Pelomonas sp. APW6]|uniref:DUF2946 family protein n=1 Tax=Roseateles subflavus TaxID=3053353 RepID=A0ABT7LCN4_9BURK|nr:DUF2946 family protein [Pelomonas sp. APW6]MDL5030622.1 DUF2946 family protein [Pelomonas sp. APW6]